MVPAITLKGRTRPQAGAETRLRMLHFFLKTVGVLRDPILVADWRVQEVAGCLLWPHPYPLVALGTHTLGVGGVVSLAGRGFPTCGQGPGSPACWSLPRATHSLSNLLFPHLCKWG